MPTSPERLALLVKQLEARGVSRSDPTVNLHVNGIVREVRREAIAETLTYIHDHNQYQDGGDHPNPLGLHGMRRCGVCQKIMEGVDH